MRIYLAMAVAVLASGCGPSIQQRIMSAYEQEVQDCTRAYREAPAERASCIQQAQFMTQMAMNQAQQQQALAAARLAAGARMMTPPPPSPVQMPTQTQCRKFGNTIDCTTY